MYRYQTAFVKPRTYPTAWVEEDISAKSIDDISNDYLSVWIALTHDHLPGDFLLSFKEVHSRSENLTGSLLAFFDLNGDRTLPTIAGKTKIDTKKSHYFDLHRTDFKTRAISRETTDTEEDIRDNYWITIESPGIEPKYLSENYLVSINGFLHSTDYDRDRFYINDAITALTNVKEDAIGLHGIGHVGALEIIPITEDMIPVRDDVSLFDLTTIKIDRDLSEYSVAMSIGGYLHICDPQTISRFGDNQVRIHWPRIDLLRRYYDSYQRIDLSSLPLTKSPIVEDLVSEKELKSDAVLRAYLLLSQSFIILIKNKEIASRIHPAEDGPFFNQYLRHVPLNYSMISEDGRILEYWAKTEMDVTSYFVPDQRRVNYRFETANQSIRDNVTGRPVTAFPNQPFNKPRAFFVEIYSTKLEHIVGDEVQGILE